MSPAVDLDRSLPVLVAKVGRYPLHHGGLGAIRTLGRLGVPVYAITEDRFTPAAVSRYLRRSFVWPTTGGEDAGELVEGLLAIGRRLPGPALVLPTDDEAAVLVAEHADELAECFLLPGVPAALPAALADKHRLHQLCRAHGVPSPPTALPSSVDELLAGAAAIGYPVVLKNARPWDRLERPAVGRTTVVHDEDALGSLTEPWEEMPSVLLQQYLPAEGAEDWIVGVYCDAAGAALVGFTGRKVRSWPPHAGVTTRAYAAANEHLVDVTARFCKELGYRGIADLDWRLDPATGEYKLLDFNPRVGAQFRLFETDAGVDVVRALHLDLSGRPVPAGRQRYDRGLRVENLDLPAVVAYGPTGWGRPPGLVRGTTERAWMALD
ncbi:MAG: ATP-grasp domain-containing protein, partial [Actinomycetota bacterium]|nr:ATP-grasp domain-containing protein [Actinomycetota bacterium]